MVVCKGFLYLDMADPAHSNAVMMLQTLCDNVDGLKTRKLKKAVLARKAQARVGTPTDANFIDIASKGTLTNFPIDPFDIANTRHMFGPDIPGVKGKTVRRKPDRVEVEDIVYITSDYHRFVSMTLTADMMFAKDILLLITLSRRIILLTMEHIPSRTAK